MSATAVVRARRSRDEEIAAARVELDSERLRRSADIEGSLPELSVVLVRQRLRDCVASIELAVGGGDVGRQRVDIAGVSLKGLEAEEVFTDER